MSFFEELKRRNVVRTATLYIVAAWVVLQAMDILFEAFELPNSASRIVILALVVGFPITLIVSWLFELTPSGLKRESDIDRAAAESGQRGKKTNALIAGLLVVAIVMLAANLFVQREPAPDGADDGISIAVLPFANRSANADDVYFVDGVHDDILTQLVRIGSLTVTSRTSVERFRNTTLSIPEIAEQLGVRHILEGGIQRAGDRVRINLQLINANNDDFVWAESYERELTAANIFEVQADIARAVTSALQVTLQTDEQVALQARPTDSIEAYDLYLLGRYHWDQRTPESIELSQDYFQRATQIDPEYVLALSGLADSYTLLIDYGNLGGEQGFPLAQAAIDKAMSLDDAVSEVWASLGLLRLQQGELVEAEEALERALELDDKNFWAWTWYGSSLQGQRRLPEALQALEAAYALEPMAIPVNTNLAARYEYQGDFARARHHYERLAEISPDIEQASRTDVAETFFLEGRLATAIERYRQLLSLDAANARAIIGLSYSYLLLGDRQEADVWNSRLSELSSLNANRTRLFEVERDYDGAVVYLEDFLVRFGDREVPQVFAALFRASYLGGRIDAAAAYHKERLSILNADIAVSPMVAQQYDPLLVADFLIRHGADYDLDPARGEMLVDEVYSALSALQEQGVTPPDLFNGLAIIEAMRGSPQTAVVFIGEAVDRGFRDMDFMSTFPPLAEVANLPAFGELQGRVQAALDEESASLSRLVLAPSATLEREPIELPLSELKSFEGYFTDGNVILRAQILDDDGLVFSIGQRGPQIDVLPFGEDRFFAPQFRGGSMEYGRDAEGQITHVEMRMAGDVQRYKRASPPPPGVSLPRTMLESYEGTYAWQRPGTSGDASADFWIGTVSVDADGTIWLDFDNQPRIEIVPFAEAKFFAPGFIQRFEFVFEDGSRTPSTMMFEADGRFLEFQRR
ncbi:MAG: hypothetical protein AAF917_06135 [Pseudomonadota bacterium]